MSTAPTSTVESDRQPLDPRARQIWMAGAAAGVVLVAVAGVVALVLAGGPWALPLFVAPVLVVGAVVYAGLHWRLWWWGTGDEALELGHGVIIRHASYVPYHRIQQIDVERGPLERAFGLARLTVHTASATTDAAIPGLALADARVLRQYLLEQAGRDDGV